MTNPLTLSDETLLQTTKNLAQKERELTVLVLHHLREVERRSLFAVLGFSSLFEYCVQELKYSEGSAQRRISSMRLLKVLPELEKKVEAGVLLLSTLSSAQTFFRHEKVKSAAEKREVLLSLEGKSTREVERCLVARSTTPLTLKAESARAVSENLTELKFLVDDSTLQKLQELRNLTAASHPNAGMGELLNFALTKTLERLRPKAPKSLAPIISPPAPAVKVVQDKFAEALKIETLTSSARSSVEAKEISAAKLRDISIKKENCNATRYIPVEVKRQVWARDGGRCTYIHEGRRCECRFGLELDHITPFAMGGANSVENLRLRCRSHNQLAAMQSFGREKISRCMPRMRQ